MKSKVLERIRKRIPLETKIRVVLTCDDYDNWENGVYKGNRVETAKLVMKEIEQHINEKPFVVRVILKKLL